MKGTRLWTRAGSPLIQGRSRAQRTFWQEWAAASFVSVAATVVLASVVILAQHREPWASEVFRVGALATMLLTLAVLTAPGALLGSALGVWLGREMGWRHSWVAGAVFGVIAGTVTCSVLSGSAFV